MELFDAKGCLSEEGLQALVGGQLDETQRLEAAEHLAYCDRCMDRYTALLTDDVLEQPPRSARGAVMGTIWIRLMQNTWGRAAVATVAAVLALTMWRAGTLEQILHTGQQLNTWLPQTTQQTEPELLGKFNFLFICFCSFDQSGDGGYIDHRRVIDGRKCPYIPGEIFKLAIVDKCLRIFKVGSCRHLIARTEPVGGIGIVRSHPIIGCI